MPHKLRESTRLVTTFPDLDHRLLFYEVNKCPPSCSVMSKSPPSCSAVSKSSPSCSVVVQSPPSCSVVIDSPPSYSAVVKSSPSCSVVYPCLHPHVCAFLCLQGCSKTGRCSPGPSSFATSSVPAPVLSRCGRAYLHACMNDCWHSFDVCTTDTSVAFPSMNAQQTIQYFLH